MKVETITLGPEPITDPVELPYTRETKYKTRGPKYSGGAGQKREGARIDARGRFRNTPRRVPQ